MPAAPEKLTGHCLCGNVSYCADAKPVLQAVCHCTDCQRQTGTIGTFVIGVARDSLTVEGSTVASFTTTGEDTGLKIERQFCSACGSPTVSLAERLPGLAFLHLGTLDDASFFEPEVESWTSSAHLWSPHFDRAERHERSPG
jgi:hypothetical protein